MSNEENKEKAKQQVKQKAKSKVRSIIIANIPTIVIILVVLVIASSVYAIISQVVDTIKNIGQSIVNFFLGDDNGIKITDEQLDSIIAAVESLGIDYDDLGLLGDVDYSSPDVQKQMQEEKKWAKKKIYKNVSRSPSSHTRIKQTEVEVYKDKYIFIVQMEIIQIQVNIL